MNIELISVGGVVFKHFAQLGATLNKKIAIITDNDSSPLEELKKKRAINQELNVRLFSEENTLIHTLEPAFVRANLSNIDKLSLLVRGKVESEETEEKLSDYMVKHKTEWAQKLLEAKSYDYDVPQYIKDAVNWLVNG